MSFYTTHEHHAHFSIKTVYKLINYSIKSIVKKGFNDIGTNGGFSAIVLKFAEYCVSML